MKKFFSRFSKACVALSGGADSAAVLMLSVEHLGSENVSAVTCTGGHVFEYELAIAKQITKKLGVRHIQIPVGMPYEFYANNPDRCYHCKKAVLTEITEFAGTFTVFDGTNSDDDPENRPGFRALEETEVISPLRELGLGKSFSQEKVKPLNIDFYDESCKATRLTLPIDQDRMDRVERIENILRNRFRGIRWRIDDNRIEFKKALRLSESDFNSIVNTVSTAV